MLAFPTRTRPSGQITIIPKPELRSFWGDSPVPWTIRVSGESKSRLVKAAGAESCGQRRNQKLHAAVARSTFPSQNVKN